MTLRITLVSVGIFTAVTCLTVFAADDANPLRVTVSNFRRAESDNYFAQFVKNGGFGKLAHEREVAPIDDQTVIRMNRDTLYSFGVLDLDASPVTVTLPDSGKRYMALQVIDEDHYAPAVYYAPGTHTLTKSDIGTRYVTLAIRTFVDPSDSKDIAAAHALQDAIKVEQKATGAFEAPDWDQASLTTMREALLGVVQANGGLLPAAPLPPAPGDSRRHLACARSAAREVDRERNGMRRTRR
jgi:hypothetical protein